MKDLTNKYGKEHYVLALDVRDHEQVTNSLASLIYCITRRACVDIEQMIIMLTVQASANHLYRSGK